MVGNVLNNYINTGCIVTENNLTAHNWQKWKSTFLTCHYHEIYREEAVGLKSSNYTLKITILWICAIWGKFGKNWYFENNCFIKNRIKKFFCTYVTHIIVIIWHTPHFYLIDFQLNTDFPSQFCVFFYSKIT